MSLVDGYNRALNIKDQLYEDLKDPAYASAYNNEAILDWDKAVLKTALAEFIRAKGVMGSNTT